MQTLEENRPKLRQLLPPRAKPAYPRPYENLMKLRIAALFLAVGLVLAACAPRAGSGAGDQPTATPAAAPTATPTSGGMDGY